MDQYLKILEKEFARRSRAAARSFKIRKVFIAFKIAMIKIRHNDIVIIDRKIVALLCHEIITKGNTSEKFQDQFFQYLDKLQQEKSDAEFN